MKKFACHYAIIRFLPYPETEEFANVGIVVACPETGFLSFKLPKRKHSRITTFFDEIGSDTYRQSLDLFELELSRISQNVRDRQHSHEELKSLFNELVHPREAIIRFSTARIRLSDSPEQVVEQLFNFYVERGFVTQEYKETILVKKVRNIVQDLKLDKPFRAMSIGDDLTSAQFPLVQTENNHPVKVIKPFFLGQDMPSKIISHGGFWVDKVKRLKKRGLLPDSTLFTIDGPDENSGNRFSAYQEICDDLKDLNVEVIRSSQIQRLSEFARI